MLNPSNFKGDTGQIKSIIMSIILSKGDTTIQTKKFTAINTIIIK